MNEHDERNRYQAAAPQAILRVKARSYFAHDEPITPAGGIYPGPDELHCVIQEGSTRPIAIFDTRAEAEAYVQGYVDRGEDGNL